MWIYPRTGAPQSGRDGARGGLPEKALEDQALKRGKALDAGPIHVALDDLIVLADLQCQPPRKFAGGAREHPSPTTGHALLVVIRPQRLHWSLWTLLPGAKP